MELLRISERINPFSFKDVEKGFLDLDYPYLEKLAIYEIDSGCNGFNINLDMEDINYKKLLKFFSEVFTRYPYIYFMIDSRNLEIIKETLENIKNPIIINSLSLNTPFKTELLELVREKESFLILMPVGTKYPLSLDEKIKNALKLMALTEEYKIPKDRIFVDCVIDSLKTNENSIEEGINILRKYRDLGFQTIMGISNVSYGMENRDLYNKKLLLEGIKNGLDIAIYNVKVLEI